MVWCRFYQYIFIGTHTHKDWREEGETRKAAETEAKSKKKKKQWKERTRHREASHGRDRLFSACSGSPGPPPPPTGRTTWEQSPGSQAGGPRGSSPAELQGATPRSSGHPAHPPPSSPSHLPPRAPPLTSGPPRQGERQQAEPDGAHAPGHGGSGPSRAPRSQARGHASPPARRRRVWNPLLAQRLPARLPAIDSDAPPSAPQGSAAGWRRGRARQEGAGGTAGKEPGGPLGAGSAQVMGSSGGRVRARGGAGFPVGAAWGGSGARASRS